ncbi:MAG: hypothetical protein KA712_09935 [Myxococcales bacterium]|nr:hypothetical protein [Myxococcales bacterium]
MTIVGKTRLTATVGIWGLWVATGEANAVTLGAEAAATVGATDNANASLSGEAKADAFISGRVGGRALWVLPSGSHALTASADVSTFLRGTRGTFTQEQVGWTTKIEPTGRSTLALSAGLLHGRLGFLDAAPSVNAAQPDSQARPAGAISYGALLLREEFAWAPTPKWRSSQALSAAGFTPLEENAGRPHSWAVDNELGLFRVFGLNQFGANARAGYARNSGVERNGVQLTPERGLTYGDANGVWKRSWTEQWSSDVGAGLFLAKADGQDVIGGPGGRVQGQYRDPDLITVTASAERRVQANVYLGDALVTEGVNLQLQRSIGKFQEWSLTLFGGYQRSRAVSEDSLYGNLAVLYARAGLAYDNQGSFRWSIDYLLSDQSIDRNTPEAMAAVSFSRNILSATLVYRWPAPRSVRGVPP